MSKKYNIIMVSLIIFFVVIAMMAYNKGQRDKKIAERKSEELMESKRITEEDYKKNSFNWRADIKIALNNVQDTIHNYGSGQITQAEYIKNMASEKERLTNVIDHMTQVNPPQFMETDYLNLSDGTIMLSNALSSFEEITDQPAGQTAKMELKEAKDYFGEEIQTIIQGIINSMPDRP